MIIADKQENLTLCTPNARCSVQALEYGLCMYGVSIETEGMISENVSIPCSENKWQKIEEALKFYYLLDKKYVNIRDISDHEHKSLWNFISVLYLFVCACS